MTSPVFQVINECTHIKFDVANAHTNYHCAFPVDEAAAFVLSLEISAEKTSLQFKEVVACRSLIVLKKGKVRHDQRIWFNQGPFPYKQFLEMMEYKKEISNNEWYEHMNNSSQVTVLSDEKG